MSAGVACRLASYLSITSVRAKTFDFDRELAPVLGGTEGVEA